MQHAQVLSLYHEEPMAAVNRDARGLSPANSRHDGSSWDGIISANNEARRSRHVRDFLDAETATKLQDVHRSNQLRISVERGWHAQALLRCHAGSNAEGMSSGASTPIRQDMGGETGPGARTTNGGAEDGTGGGAEGGGTTHQGQVSATPTLTKHAVGKWSETANGGVRDEGNRDKQEDGQEQPLRFASSAATQQKVDRGAEPWEGADNGDAEEGATVSNLDNAQVQRLLLSATSAAIQQVAQRAEGCDTGMTNDMTEEETGGAEEEQGRRGREAGEGEKKGTEGLERATDGQARACESQRQGHQAMETARSVAGSRLSRDGACAMVLREGGEKTSEDHVSTVAPEFEVRVPGRGVSIGHGYCPKCSSR